MSGKSFSVHNCIDTYGMSICTCGSTYYYDLSAEVLFDIFIHFIHRHGLFFYCLYMDISVVYCVNAAAVANVECKFCIQSMVMCYVDIFQSHQFAKLSCCFFSALIIFDR